MEFMTLLTLICYPALVWSHARLMSPPSRSSMWRLGFPTKKNFNDNALYCGGLSIQWQKNGGKCGICGDPYNMPYPRDNEAGGKYGRGIISKRYVSDQIIQATVDVTTNHRGYFEFKLCPNNNPKKEATQECLDKFFLGEAHDTGNRYYIGDRGNGNIAVMLQLPKGLTCSQCVFQWTYVAGNNWGKCEDGESRLGCGPQETFRGCADIAIEKSPGIFNTKPNENDVGNKHHAINPHKIRNHGYPKVTTIAKSVVYTYEVTKQSRQHVNKTVFDENHNSHHRDHSHSDHDRRKFHQKTGEFLPPFTDQPGHSNEERPGSNEPLNRGNNHKYDNRHFYLHNNNALFRQNSTNRQFLANNNGWPIGNGQIHPGNKNRRIRRKHNIQNSRQEYSQNSFPFMRPRNSEDDIKLSHSFSLGGRRYKDFWLL